MTSAGTRRTRSPDLTTQDLHELIIQSAARCFRRKGVQRTRMEDIAEDVGMQRPHLYRHFPGKKSLIVAVIVRESRAIHRRRAEALTLQGPVGSVIVDALVLGFELCISDEFVGFNMAPDAIGLTAEVVASETAIVEADGEYWNRVLDYGRERGEIRAALTNDQIIRWFLLMQFTFLQRKEFFGDPAVVRRHIRDFVVPAVITYEMEHNHV
jgi:AcrR family transcriptional regulator